MNTGASGLVLPLLLGTVAIVPLAFIATMLRPGRRRSADGGVNDGAIDSGGANVFDFGSSSGHACASDAGGGDCGGGDGGGGD